MRGGIQSLSPRPTEVESSLFLLLEEVPLLLESSPHRTTEVPETFLENHTPLACVQSLPQQGMGPLAWTLASLQILEKALAWAEGSRLKGRVA